MSRIARSLQSHQNVSNEEVHNNVFLLGKKRNTPLLYCPIYDSPKVPLIQEEPTPANLYHKNPKYGASKYTSSLQVGKMHKIVATQ